MRNIFKSISIAIVAAAALSTTAVADEICYNLCMSCRNTERAENCDKIESTCNCPFVIDSAKSRNMGIELGKRIERSGRAGLRWRNGSKGLPG